VLYTWSHCPFCLRAKEILDSHGVPFTEHVMDGKSTELSELKRKYGHATVPLVLLDGELVGGCDALEELARRGGLTS